VGVRLTAIGWNVICLPDANDTAAAAGALDQAKAHVAGPTIIVVQSMIGFGAPKKAGTREARGEPLGDEEARGAKARHAWMDLMARYRERYRALARELDMIDRHELPEGWDSDIPVFPADAKGVASRESSRKVLNAIARRVPWMIGGAADLAPSTKSSLTFEGAGSFEADSYGGRNLRPGIREHATGSICDDIAMFGLRAYGSGFLIFSDYMRASNRLPAIMELLVIYIFIHDSIGAGEDGPTHQPVEQLASLRALPGMIVLRPADADEVAKAWRVMIRLRDRPTCLVLSRQALPTIDRGRCAPASGVARGAYVVADCDGFPAVVLMATSSELSLYLGAYETLTAEGAKARVVSMPGWKLFEVQDESYRDAVLPPASGAGGLWSRRRPWAGTAMAARAAR